jgi:hypothetical protein
MPQYAVLIYADDSAHDPDATPEDLAECDDHAGELLAADSMLLAFALTPRAMATSIRSGEVGPGPMVDARDVVAGFYVIEAADDAEAQRIARTNPVALGGNGGVEVRPVHSGGVVRPPRD